MVYVIHEIPIFIAMGVVGKDGRRLQAWPSCGSQRSSWSHPCWLSRAVGKPTLGDGAPLGWGQLLSFLTQFVGGPSILGYPLWPPATWQPSLSPTHLLAPSSSQGAFLELCSTP